MSFRWPGLFCAFIINITSISIAAACDRTAELDCGRQDTEQIREAAALIEEQRYAEAADLLEHILMRDPDNEAALGLYTRSLIGMDNIGEEQIQFEVERMNALQASWQTDGSIQIRGGYGSNLNQAPTQSTLQLTLPSQLVTLELQPEFLRQAGFGFETQLSAGAAHAFSDAWQWQLRGDLYNRETEYSGFADYQGANLLTVLTRKWQDGAESGAALAFNGLRYGGDVYLYTAQMLLRHAGVKGDYCKPQMGADLLWQRQHDSPILDSRYTGVMIGAFCDTPWGYYNASISAGWDWAAENRPGGDQQRTRLDVTGLWSTDALSKDSFVRARANFLYSADMRFYSPWLSDGANRTIARVGLGVDYDWALSFIGNDWRGVASVSWQNQDSNISLFEMDAFEGWLGFRYAW